MSPGESVTILGVNEHIWHHVSTEAIEAGGRGPKELTGMATWPEITAAAPVRGCWTWFRVTPGQRTRSGGEVLEQDGVDGLRSEKLTHLDKACNAFAE